ncbi:hypothetical protein BJ508DRAFT_48402 [Ascobolus immersus RN42]|uniref:Uncharacterized protein n=1 Tax=Ascobolus immersus RN42 TaxID=1160509 RepID=A0A3N4HVE4_ASCIM|nr:hypothetical protein BJ508DRAFT_48402 [Ascobolus immersus RN42]
MARDMNHQLDARSKALKKLIRNNLNSHLQTAAELVDHLVSASFDRFPRHTCNQFTPEFTWFLLPWRAWVEPQWCTWVWSSSLVPFGYISNASRKQPMLVANFEHTSERERRTMLTIWSNDMLRRFGEAMVLHFDHSPSWSWSVILQKYIPKYMHNAIQSKIELFFKRCSFLTFHGISRDALRFRRSCSRLT